MNKILSITLLFGAALAFTACTGEEDDLFDKSAAERLDESKAVYTQRFAANGGKWVMEYYPTNGSAAPQGKGYLMLLEFSSKGWVRIAMNNEMSDNKYQEDTSLWKVIADQGPVLSFCTYNANLHYFSDPAIYDTGLGYEGDYEFEIIDLQENAELAMLKGKKRGTYIRLTALPADTDFDQYLTEVNEFKNTIFSSSSPTDSWLTIGDSTFVMTDVASGIVSMYPLGGDQISQSSDYPYLITFHDGLYHFRFKSAITGGGEQSEQELVYNVTDDKFYGLTSQANTITAPYENAESFFKEKFDGGHTFKVYRKNADDVSAKMKDYLDAASNAMTAKNKKYQIDSVSVRYVADLGTTWLFKYQTGSSAQEIVYKYDMQMDGNKVTFTYKEPAAVNGANILNTVPEIKKLMTEVLSKKFTIEKYNTLFNLRKIKLTAEDDKDLWFVLNY